MNGKIFWIVFACLALPPMIAVYVFIGMHKQKQTYFSRNFAVSVLESETWSGRPYTGPMGQVHQNHTLRLCLANRGGRDVDYLKVQLDLSGSGFSGGRKVIVLANGVAAGNYAYYDWPIMTFSGSHPTQQNTVRVGAELVELSFGKPAPLPPPAATPAPNATPPERLEGDEP